MDMPMVLLFCIVPAISAFHDSSYDDLWKAYKEKYQKDGSANFEDARRSIWEQNVLNIAKHNVEADFGLHSFTVGVNKFTDMFEQELDVYRRCLKHRVETEPVSRTYYKCDRSCFETLPNSVDWRTKNFVTPIKDQGDCGSCWSFSSTGALEGQTKAKTGNLVSLSEQNLVDCSTKQGNQGCDGGWMDYAFQYVMDNQGIDTEKVYPYKAREGHCHFVRSGVGANCTGFVNIPKGSEKDLQAAVANIGPIAVAIDASGDKFMSYKKGIYYDKTCTTTDLDHAVLVVGYGSNNGTDYWIVKNSWGTEWGMDGYILMARNRGNMCGIASHALYPVV